MLRAIQEAPYEQAARVRLSSELASGMERVMHELMHATAERELASVRFISEVRHAAPRARESSREDRPGESPAPDRTYTH